MITSATFQSYEQVGTDLYKVRVRLVTNDERTTFDHWLMVRGATAAELRDDASRQIADLNDRRTTRDALTGIAAGTVIPITRPAAPTPSAFQVWLTKAQRLVRVKQMALTNATAVAEVSALEADVNNTFVAGYVAQL
jgi:hypothetical protein